MKNDSVIFRPMARIIRTLGDKLIKDAYAAIIELVKNGYDADARKVNIEFKHLEETDRACIIISDDGHGMDYSTIIDKWMIPGTTDKIKRRTSPGGRIMLGEKGIGRLAAARLGKILTLQTTDTKKNTTTIMVDWSVFEKDTFLDEIEFPVETGSTTREHGTELIIENINVAEWNSENIKTLKKELRKLLSPVSTKQEEFEIYLDFSCSGIETFKNYSGMIEPFPVLDYFDYRLSGEIDDEGKGVLIYQNGVDRNIPDEKISVSVRLKEGMARCGKIKIDVRVFDRDVTSINELIKRAGLKDESGNFMGRTEARKLLNDFSGVGIYREDFRIRPYGDAGYDWLELDKRRVQNPSMRVGSDQIAGYITVESEEISHLKEKSSREGLIEDKYFNTLKETVIASLTELENRRFNFRQKTGRGRVATDIEKSLETIFDFSKMEESIHGMVQAGRIDSSTGNTIIETIQKEKKAKEEYLERIREVLARYEGQVTLGKIIGVLMHEGRKPLKYIDEECPRIVRWIDNLRQKEILPPDDSIFTKDEIIEGLGDIKKEGELLIDLFNKLDPLAVKKRKRPSIVDMEKIVFRMYNLFKGELKMGDIEFIRDWKGDFTFYGVDNDVYIALTNLMDNSIYWLSTLEKGKKFIRISLKYEKNILILDFADNGPGIKKEFVESIFEPGFSTKPDGTGLGLSIAGEAISRNNGKIQLLDYKEGAYFRIELPGRREK